MKLVLLDTNFLMIPVEFRIDIFEGIRNMIPDASFATVSGVIRELGRIKDGKIAEKIINRENVKVVDREGKVDDALLNYAKEKDAVVCTNDKELKERCLKQGITVIFMRDKSKLDIMGG